MGGDRHRNRHSDAEATVGDYVIERIIRWTEQHRGVEDKGGEGEGEG